MTGPYFYDEKAVDSRTHYVFGAARTRDHRRGPRHLEFGALSAGIIGLRYAELDTATPDSLLAGAKSAGTFEKRQAFRSACLEEIAVRQCGTGTRYSPSARAIMPPMLDVS